jgi:hypothetical protein
VHYALCTVYYSDQQIENIYINYMLYIVNTDTCFIASASSSGILNVTKLLKSQINKIGRLKWSRVHACREHQSTDYIHKTVQIVCAVIKHTTSTFLSINVLQMYFILQQRSREYFNQRILASCNCNNFVTLAKHKVNTC